MPLLDDLKRLAAGLSVEACPRCGLRSERGFCPACRRDFDRVPEPCPSCGLPGPGHACPAAGPGWHIDAVRAPFVYAAPLARFVHGLKYARQRHLGRALGELLAAEIAAAPVSVEALLAMPLHRRRLKERRFNQADEILRPLLRALPLRGLGSAARRIRDTESLAALGRRERIAAVAGAFAVRPALEARAIAIVDDVITTGATINALARALKSAGARRVEAWAVARTIGPDTATLNRR